MSGTASTLPPGFKKQVLGATLAALGCVDTVMNLITGIALDGFFIFLIGAGIALFVFGARQKRMDRYQATCG
jgi:hypothetical protein